MQIKNLIVLNLGSVIKKIYVIHCLDEICHFVELGFNNCNSMKKKIEINELT